MATPYIVMGCPTTGGGQVITGNSSFLIEGIPIACVGDKATCPKHQTVSIIIAGDPHMQVMGKAAARVNDALSCGCKLLPKQGLVVQDNGGGFSNSEQRKTKSNEMHNNFVKEESSNFDEQIKLEDIHGRPYANIDYLVTYEDGTTKQGETDDEGNTERLKTENALRIISIDLYVDSNCNESCSCEV